MQRVPFLQRPHRFWRPRWVVGALCRPTASPSMSESQWVQSQDLSWMLQTQPATEGQMQMQLETPAYIPADVWGFELLQMEDQMLTQPYITPRWKIRWRHSSIMQTRCPLQLW